MPDVIAGETLVDDGEVSLILNLLNCALPVSPMMDMPLPAKLRIPTRSLSRGGIHNPVGNVKPSTGQEISCRRTSTTSHNQKRLRWQGVVEIVVVGGQLD